MTEKKGGIDLSKVAKKLLLQLGFVCISLVFLSNIAHKILCDYMLISMESLLNFNNGFWYIGYYFVVVVIAALFLNRILLDFRKEQYISFLLTVFAITQFTWSAGLLNGIGGNLNLLLTGIFLYALGGFIKIYNPFKRIRSIVFYGTILFLYLIIYISYYNSTMTHIEKFLRDNPNGIYIQSFMWFDNSSLVVIILAVCIFEIFTRLKISYSRIINFLGASTFMVYLIHDNSFFYSLWNSKDWIIELYETPRLFLIELLMWSVATFFVGVALYILYELLTKAFAKVKWLFMVND